MSLVEKFIEQLATQSPAAVAVIFCVVYFLKAIKDRDSLNAKTQMDRDKLFNETLRQRDEVFATTMARIATQLSRVESAMLVLDTNARNAMRLKETKKHPREGNEKNEP